MPVKTSRVPHRSCVSFFALILGLLTLTGCSGSAKPPIVCSTSNGGDCSCGGSSTAACPAQVQEVLYSLGGTFSTGTQFQIFPINPTTGTLGSPAVESGVSLQGNIAITPSGQFYYAADDNEIYGYSIGPGGALTALTGSPFPEHFLNPLDMTVDPDGKFLYVSDTADASVAVFDIDSSTGAPSEVTGSPFSNNSLYTNRVALTPSGNFLYVIDGGSDTGIVGLSAYSVNRATGSLTPVSGGTFTYSGGDGEFFDIAVHPSGKFLYFSEDDGIHAFTIDSNTGALTQFPSQPLVALPSPFQITLNSSGTVLYVAVGGADTIAAYSLNPSSGALIEVAGSPYRIGPSPAPARVLFSFALDPLDQFLYVSEGEISSTFGIMEFSVNSGTGALTQLGIVPGESGSDFGPFWPVPFAAVRTP